MDATASSESFRVSPRAHTIVVQTKAKTESSFWQKRRQGILHRRKVQEEHAPRKLSSTTNTSGSSSSSSYTYDEVETSHTSDDSTVKQALPEPPASLATAITAAAAAAATTNVTAEDDNEVPMLSAKQLYESVGYKYKKAKRNVPLLEYGERVQHRTKKERVGFVSHVWNDDWEKLHAWPKHQFYYAVEYDDGLFESCIEESKLQKTRHAHSGGNETYAQRVEKRQKQSDTAKNEYNLYLFTKINKARNTK